MNTQGIAIWMILVFLGQQAGVVWANVMDSNGHPHGHASVTAAQDDSMATHCDGAAKTPHGDVQQHMADAESDDCCNLECECCVGHCQSTLALISPYLDLYHSNRSRTAATYQPTRTSHQGHFRPPIFA